MTAQKSVTFSRHISWTSAALALSFFAFGCQPDQEPKTEGPPLQTSAYRLSPASNCAALSGHVVDVTTEQILRDRYNNYWFGAEDASAGGNNNAQAPSADGGNGEEKQSPDDYTGTNNQEEGVDEADFLKTDGEYIYTIAGSDVVILDSWPAEQTHEVARFTIAENQDGWPSAMFLDGDSLAVLSYIYDYEERYDENGEWIEDKDSFYGTRITVMDISDRTNPRLDRQIDIEGWYTNARMIGGDVYVVSNSGLQFPDNYWSLIHDNENLLPAPEYDADEARLEQLRNQARPIVKAILNSKINQDNVTEMLPRKRVYNSSGAQILQEPLYNCTDIFLPSQLAQTGVLNITHFDLGEKSSITSTGLMANGWQVYASTKSLYIAMTSGWWWWGWGTQDLTTHIHKFDLDTPDDRPAYTASGKVDGWLLNQFSMSEHNGFLRVATTDNQWVWDEATQTGENVGGNHVTILEQSQGDLKETGSIRDLAPGEQIFAARFMGDKGYVVTFEQVDPLFTFDLSDPYNPKLEGELKINGFSSYIHPLGANHLLTIGQDADSDGRITGVHLQIFDVTDMKNPTRTAQHKISTGSWSSWSEAMWDHHAFTYHPVKKILAVPMNIHDWEENNGENFSGLILYKIDEAAGISEIGRVNHSDMAANFWCEFYDNASWACEEGDERYRWWTSIRRSVFIEDYVYSFGDVGLKVNDLLAPANEHVSLVLNHYNR